MIPARARKELTATEYAEHMQRRKEVWEALQSEAESGATCATFENGGRGHEGFAESTAQSTGQSKSQTNRATKRAWCSAARRFARR